MEHVFSEMKAQDGAGGILQLSPFGLWLQPEAANAHMKFDPVQVLGTSLLPYGCTMYSWPTQSHRKSCCFLPYPIPIRSSFGLGGAEHHDRHQLKPGNEALEVASCHWSRDATSLGEAPAPVALGTEGAGEAENGQHRWGRQHWAWQGQHMWHSHLFLLLPSSWLPASPLPCAHQPCSAPRTAHCISLLPSQLSPGFGTTPNASTLTPGPTMTYPYSQPGMG